jgi:hypothetical protein
MDQMAILPAAPPSRLGNEAVVTEDEPHPSPGRRRSRFQPIRSRTEEARGSKSPHLDPHESPAQRSRRVLPAGAAPSPSGSVGSRWATNLKHKVTPWAVDAAIKKQQGAEEPALGKAHAAAAKHRDDARRRSGRYLATLIWGRSRVNSRKPTP